MLLEDFHEVVVVEVEDDFERVGTGVENDGGSDQNLLRFSLAASEGQFPFGPDQNVADVELGLVQKDEIRGLASETIEELLAPRQRKGEIGSAERLTSQGAGKLEGVCKPGHSAGHVPGGDFRFIGAEELFNCVFRLVH